MWLLKSLLAALFIVLIVWFILANDWVFNTQVKLKLPFSQTKSISAGIVLLLSFVAGFMAWFFVSLYYFIKLRSEIVAKDRVIKNLKSELNELRNIPLGQEGAEISNETMVLNRNSMRESALFRGIEKKSAPE